MVLNLFGGNLDWDDHNWYAVRQSRNAGVATNQFGGYRFIAFDTERILEGIGDNGSRSKRPAALAPVPAAQGERGVPAPVRGRGPQVPVQHRRAADPGDGPVPGADGQGRRGRRPQGAVGRLPPGLSPVFRRPVPALHARQPVAHGKEPPDRRRPDDGDGGRQLFQRPAGGVPQPVDLRGALPVGVRAGTEPVRRDLSAGFGATLTIPGGTAAGTVIYYTLDGSDPRLAGGGIKPGVFVVFRHIGDQREHAHVRACVHAMVQHFTPALMPPSWSAPHQAPRD